MDGCFAPVCFISGRWRVRCSVCCVIGQGDRVVPLAHCPLPQLEGEADKKMQVSCYPPGTDYCCTLPGRSQGLAACRSCPRGVHLPLSSPSSPPSPPPRKKLKEKKNRRARESERSPWPMVCLSVVRGLPRLLSERGPMDCIRWWLGARCIISSWGVQMNPKFRQSPAEKLEPATENMSTSKYSGGFLSLPGTSFSLISYEVHIYILNNQIFGCTAAFTSSGFDFNF